MNLSLLNIVNVVYLSLFLVNNSKIEVKDSIDSMENSSLFEEDAYCKSKGFYSVQQQADSLKLFIFKALDTNLNEREKWERKFFCAFPNSYEEMDSLFGFYEGATPLYFSEIPKKGSFYGSMNSYISFFGNLNSIPDDEYYEKYINICVDGYWQADNIRTAFGFGLRLMNNPQPSCRALMKRNDKEIKSVFRFIFDSVHPKHDTNKKFYIKLLPVIESEDPRLALLLKDAYEQLMSENHGH